MFQTVVRGGTQETGSPHEWCQPPGGGQWGGKTPQWGRGLHVPHQGKEPQASEGLPLYCGSVGGGERGGAHTGRARYAPLVSVNEGANFYSFLLGTWNLFSS